MGDREMGRDVKANTKRVRHCLNEAQKKIFSLKVVRKQVSRLFQSLCRPSSSSHFIWLKMLMKVDETALNTKWWKSKNKRTGSGGSDRKEKKSRPWANEHYYYKEWHAWGPLKDLCNRINCTCHVALVTLLKMLRGNISTCLEVNSVETSVMCCIHMWNLHYRINFFSNVVFSFHYYNMTWLKWKVNLLIYTRKPLYRTLDEIQLIHLKIESRLHCTNHFHRNGWNTKGKSHVCEIHFCWFGKFLLTKRQFYN